MPRKESCTPGTIATCTISCSMCLRNKLPRAKSRTYSNHGVAGLFCDGCLGAFLASAGVCSAASGPRHGWMRPAAEDSLSCETWCLLSSGGSCHRLNKVRTAHLPQVCLQSQPSLPFCLMLACRLILCSDQLSNAVAACTDRCASTDNVLIRLIHLYYTLSELCLQCCRMQKTDLSEKVLWCCARSCIPKMSCGAALGRMMTTQ